MDLHDIALRNDTIVTPYDTIINVLRITQPHALTIYHRFNVRDPWLTILARRKPLYQFNGQHHPLVLAPFSLGETTASTHSPWDFILLLFCRFAVVQRRITFWADLSTPTISEGSKSWPLLHGWNCVNHPFLQPVLLHSISTLSRICASVIALS